MSFKLKTLKKNDAIVDMHMNLILNYIHSKKKKKTKCYLKFIFHTRNTKKVICFYSKSLLERDIIIMACVYNINDTTMSDFKKVVNFRLHRKNTGIFPNYIYYSFSQTYWY